MERFAKASAIAVTPAPVTVGPKNLVVGSLAIKCTEKGANDAVRFLPYLTLPAGSQAAPAQPAQPAAVAAAAAPPAQAAAPVQAPPPAPPAQQQQAAQPRYPPPRPGAYTGTMSCKTLAGRGTSAAEFKSTETPGVVQMHWRSLYTPLVGTCEFELSARCRLATPEEAAGLWGPGVPWRPDPQQPWWTARCASGEDVWVCADATQGRWSCWSYVPPVPKRVTFCAKEGSWYMTVKILSSIDWEHNQPSDCDFTMPSKP